MVKKFATTFLAFHVLAPKISLSAPITLGAITGAWELRTACMNQQGRPGACIVMKQGSLQITFRPDGSWSSLANDKAKTNKNGSYEVRSDRLIMKNVDGSTYQDWQPDVSSDGLSFLVTSKQLIEAFVRVAPATNPE